MEIIRGASVAQLFKGPTLDFSSGHGLRVMRSGLCTAGCGVGLGFSLSPPKKRGG